MEPNPKKKRLLVAGMVALSNSVLLLSLGASNLFKHGSEHIFGLEARTWGFALLGISILGVAVASAVLVEAKKAGSD